MTDSNAKGMTMVKAEDMPKESPSTSVDCSNSNADNQRTNDKNMEVTTSTKRKRANRGNAKRKAKRNPWEAADDEYDKEVKKLKQSLLKGRDGNRHDKRGKHKDLYRGPYIHIKGNVRDPRCETIVNKLGSSNNKEKTAKSVPLAKADIHHKQIKAHPANRWDASQVDYSWVCVFCGKQHNVDGLGDLFGPYIVNTEQLPITIPTNVNVVPSDGSLKDSLKYLKRTELASAGLKKRNQAPKAQMNALVLNSDMSEVWVHQDCLIWSDGVFWVPGEAIRGLQEAVIHAAQLKCSFCGSTGANVGCIGRGCNKQYHYVCARDRGCLLDHDAFTVYCPKHRVAQEKAMEAIQRAS